MVGQTLTILEPDCRDALLRNARITILSSDSVMCEETDCNAVGRFLFVATRPCANLCLAYCESHALALADTLRLELPVSGLGGRILFRYQPNKLRHLREVIPVCFPRLTQAVCKWVSKDRPRPFYWAVFEYGRSEPQR